MSSPDLIDPRFEEIAAELRAGRPQAGAELRERVGALSAGETEPVAPKPRRRLGFRRPALVLVPAALAAVAAAVVIGVVDSGGSERSVTSQATARQARSFARPGPLRAQKPVPPASRPPVQDSLRAKPAAPAVSSGRAQLYAADLTLRVRDLSASTKRALNLTRSFGGYVRSVDYGSGTRSGTASLVLRIPVGSVQAAIVRFSALGAILDQHVSIQDIQPSIDRRFRRLQNVRREITRLQERLGAAGLSEEQRSVLEARLSRARAQLVSLQREQAQTRTRASFATVGLDLRTRKAQIVPPVGPDRLDRTLDRIGDILLKELEILLYVLVLGAPFAALGVLAAWGLRAGRRRSEDRLLAR
jgi:hypothetical protein